MVTKGTVAPELYLKNLRPEPEYPGLLLLLQLLHFSALIRMALLLVKPNFAALLEKVFTASVSFFHLRPQLDILFVFRRSFPTFSS
jgi:hypothetical protein